MAFGLASLKPRDKADKTCYVDEGRAGVDQNVGQLRFKQGMRTFCIRSG
jgi:hypothetical protein